MCPGRENKTPTREPIEPAPLDTIARRAELLQRILDGRTTKRELESVLDVSGSTLDRAIRCLDEKGIITYRGGECTVTAYGRLALREYERLVDRYETLEAAKPLLCELESDLSLGIELLRGAEVILADSSDPWAPIRRLNRLLEECHSIAALLPALQPTLVDALHEHLTERSIEADLVVTAEQIERLFARESERIRDLLALDTCTIRSIERGPEVGISLIDDEHVWIAVHGENESLSGALVSEVSVTIEWARDTLRAYGSGADPVQVRGGPTRTAA